MSSRKKRVPRVIYSLWLQGVHDAPEVVRFNFKRWVELNPKYEVNILDRSAVKKLLYGSPFKLRFMTPQAVSDVVRSRLLLETGGIWVDASVFPTRPLDEWLHPKITSSGFFAFEKPGPDRPISSWFLASTSNNYIIHTLWGEIKKYWSSAREPMTDTPNDPITAVTTPARFPYFWFHYLFQLLLERNPTFAAEWAACTKVSADAPHAMQKLFANIQKPQPHELEKLKELSPIHKLNWRSNYPLKTLASL